MEKTQTLSDYLKNVSDDICSDNGCTDDHNCESYAYIDKDMNLLDVCISDYFTGSSEPYAAVAMPWNGTQEELEAEVLDQCADFDESV